MSMKEYYDSEDWNDDQEKIKQLTAKNAELVEALTDAYDSLPENKYLAVEILGKAIAKQGGIGDE